MFHVPHGTPYHVENSRRGVRIAARKGYDQIDLDLQMTKNHVVVASHWSQPMKNDGFYDPQHRLAKSRTIRSMTYAEVHRLRTRSGYRIAALQSLIPLLAEYRLTGSLEVKGDSRFANVSVMERIKGWCDQYGVNAYVKEIPWLAPKHAETLRAARMAGFWTRNAGVPSPNWRPPAS